MAQVDATKPQETNHQISNSPQSELKTDFMVLEAQLKTIEKYQDKLLSTVQWAIGGTITIVLGAAGLGLFANYRFYKNDKATIDKDFELIRNDLSTSLTMLRKRVDGRFEKFTDDSIVKIEDHIEKEINTGRELFSNMIEKNKKSIIQEMNQLKFDIAKLEYLDWMRQKVYTNCLRSAIEMLRYTESYSNDYFFTRAMDLIVESLELIIDKGDIKLRSDLSGELESALHKVPSKYSVKIEKIKQLLSKVVLD
jgi:hypothetical protein